MLFDISMLIGNTQAQESIQKYFDLIQEQGQVDFPFLLLAGPESVGKRSVVEEKLKTLLENYYSTDYLPLYDLSDFQGKKHTLKVEVSPKDQQVTIDEQHYVDMWTRDIVQRLSLSPLGTYKVVLLENIERMTISAANAFLKTFEEPLAWRLIIATTANKDALLDTIVSRAFIVNFQTPGVQEVKEHIDQRYPEKTAQERLFATSFSVGRIGFAKKLLEGEDIAETSTSFDRLVHLFRSEEDAVVEKYSLIKTLSERWGTSQLLDALMYALSSETSYVHHRRLLQARNMLRGNVGQDNVLFWLSL